MRRTVPLERTSVRRILTADADSCAICGADTRVCQHRRRRIHDLDETIDLVCRDKACTNPDCPNPRLRYRPVTEATLALPRLEFSLDVVLEIGSMRLRDDFSFPRIHQRLRERPSPVPISPMSVQYQFRNYLSLVGCQVALKDGQLRERLREQGAILPIVDGIQFGSGDAVLYLVIDALSRQPLLLGQSSARRVGVNEVLSRASSVFLETSVLICYIEEHAGFFPAVAEVVDAVDRGEKWAVSSHVALFEVLSKPFELGRDDLVQRYKSLLLGHPHVRIVPIGAEIAVEAARIRATYRLKKALDALQLATAKLHGAEAFLTNDVELKRFDEIPVVVLKDCL